MSPDMIPIHQPLHLRFIMHRVALQPRNSIFHRAAKTRADLKALTGSTIGDHGKLPVLQIPAEFPKAENYFSAGLKFFLLVPILKKTPARR